MGLSVRDFYCCGQFKSSTVNITSYKKQTCNNGVEKKGCCESKYHFFKVKDNHISGKDVDIPLNYFIDLDLFPSAIQSISFALPQINIINGSHAPPLFTGVPIYISHCVFRI
jgi:hypothetical protein